MSALPVIVNPRRKHVAESPFKKKICGDIFGTSMSGDNSMLGMLYRSRVQEALLKKKIVNRQEDRSDEKSNDDVSLNSADIFDESSDSDNGADEAINPRHRLALTIRNWSVNEENDQYIIREGAVHALIALAGSDDHRIKQCCASALYHLSCRKHNRAELLSLGSATGIITIAMSARHWKIAKLCAQALLNLSMEIGGETTMAKEGAILALVILLGIRNQRLAPTCVQALYNLTCVHENFKGMERIVKALLTLPSVTFDATPFVVGGVLNCSRFPPLRMRIIEDGVLQTFTAVVNSLSHRELHRAQLVFNISSCVRQLSETVMCRQDMISKGAIELFQQLLPFCNDASRLLCIKALFNLLSVIQTFPTTIFEVAVNVVTDVIQRTYDETALQYAAACFHTFTVENMRGIPRLAMRVVKSLPRLLQCSHSLTQFYSIMTTSNMFFNGLIEDQSQLMMLAGKAVETGYTVHETCSIQALVQSVARLTQDSKYVALLEKDKLLNEMLNLLLQLITDSHEDSLILESCCVGVCRIALQVKEIDAKRRQKIANMLITLLDKDESDVLASAISSVRALLENDICHDDLMSNVLITRIANIIVRYASDGGICRNGCAVLTVLSYDADSHKWLASDPVVDVLFKMTRSDDIVVRELVAACLCNISIDAQCRTALITKGVVDVIASLSGATSERIQELCAKSICNLTCTIDMHKQMIENNILQTTLMISLVRSVSNTTKQLCARALLNMITEANLKSIVEAGVIRAFSTLCLLDDTITQHICARAFLMLSATDIGRVEIVQKRTVIQSLFSLVKAISGKTRVLMGKAVFNLLSNENSRTPLIEAGALSVLKIISTLEYDDLREGTARVIVSLARTRELEKFLMREPVVPVLVLIMRSTSRHSSRGAFECALNALSCLCQTKLYWPMIIEKSSVSALTSSVISGRVDSIHQAEEICRCICLLSYSKAHAEMILLKDHCLLALHILHSKEMCSAAAAEMIVLSIRNLSVTDTARSHIVEQDGVGLIRSLLKQFAPQRPRLVSAAMLVLHNLGLEVSLHKRLLEEGMMEMVDQVSQLVTNVEDMSSIASPGSSSVNTTEMHNVYTAESNLIADKLNQTTKYDLIMAIKLISQSTDCREGILAGNVVQIFSRVITCLSMVAKHQVACALNCLSASRDCRAALVEQGAVEILVSLAQSNYLDTQLQCSLALGHLSENTTVKNGTVAQLLLLSLKSEELKDAASMFQGRRGSTLSGQQDSAGDATIASTATSAPARELLAMQSVKSLKVMIQDGLQRNKQEHGVSLKPERSNSATNLKALPSAEMAFVPESLDTNTDYLVFSDDEKAALCRSYDGIEYTVTAHASTHEPGGLSKQLRIDLPLPTIKKSVVTGEDRSAQLEEVPVSLAPLQKNEETHEIVELQRYASTQLPDTEEIEELPRTWSVAMPPKSAPSEEPAIVAAKARRRKKTPPRLSHGSHAQSYPEGAKLWESYNVATTASPSRERNKSFSRHRSMGEGSIV